MKLLIVLVVILLLNSVKCAWYRFPEIGKNNETTNLYLQLNKTKEPLERNRYEYYLYDCKNSQVIYFLKMNYGQTYLINFNGSVCPWLLRYDTFLGIYSPDFITINYVLNNI